MAVSLLNALCGRYGHPTQASERYERWYSRMRRAVNAMEKERQHVIRLQRQLAKLD